MHDAARAERQGPIRAQLAEIRAQREGYADDVVGIQHGHIDVRAFSFQPVRNCRLHTKRCAGRRNGWSTYRKIVALVERVARVVAVVDHRLTHCGARTSAL